VVYRWIHARERIAVKLEVAADLVRLAPGTGAGVVSDRAGSLANIHHSGSRTATIRITRHAREVMMQISDQGRGSGRHLNNGGFSQSRSESASGACAKGSGKWAAVWKFVPARMARM